MGKLRSGRGCHRGHGTVRRSALFLAIVGLAATTAPTTADALGVAGRSVTTSVPSSRGASAVRGAVDSFGSDPLAGSLNVAAVATSEAARVPALVGTSVIDDLDQQASNLDRVRDLLPAQQNSPLETCTEQVDRVRMMMQDSMVAMGDVTPSPAVTNLLPSEAIVDFLARHGISKDPDDPALAGLDALEPTFAQALANWIHAFSVLEAAADEVFDGLDALAAGELDLTALDLPRIEFLHATKALCAQGGGGGGGGGNGTQLPPTDHFEVAPFISIDLRSMNTTYDVDYMLQFDQAGNDVYRNNAGGATRTIGATGAMGAAALIDMSGTDLYDNPSDFAVNGGGSLGVGFLLDAAGNDTYNGGNGGTNGGATIGAGTLIDVAGNDTYQAASNGTNGGGALGGVGMLIDGGGDDRYTAGGGGTNGGGNTGTGTLIDLGGGDRYTAGANGTNGGGSAGVGLLVDVNGSDTYSATSGGTNGGATAGTGTLIDGGGTDSYTAYSQGTNGGGWEGAGLLVDAGGTDMYTAGRTGTNGGGNLGSGILIDAGGNDSFTAQGTGVNGGASLGSGLLVDNAGNDFYTAQSGGVNGGGSLGAALLLDVAGRDTYSDWEGGSGIDRTVVIKGTAGAQDDADADPGVPELIAPAAGALLNYGQPEEFDVRSTNSDNDVYFATVTVRNATTNQSVWVGSSEYTPSGVTAAVLVGQFVPPGSYRWSAHATDAVSGRVSPESAPRNLTIVP